MSAVRIGIVGVAGRMGQTLVREIAATPGAVVGGGLERPGAPQVGLDPGVVAGTGATGVVIVDDAARLFGSVDAVIDFSSPAVLARHAALAAQSKSAYVVGITGLEAAHFTALEQASHHCAVVQDFNMSLGVNLLTLLTRQVAAALDAGWDIEIVEMHHRMKVDAPSGTAIKLGEAAAAGRGIDLAANSERGRDGITGARRAGAIGFAALRGGNVAGEHSVIFAADNERIEITHKATDRSIFARGAVRAALWARGQVPGYYRMADVLGLAG